MKAQGEFNRMTRRTLNKMLFILTFPAVFFLFPLQLSGQKVITNDTVRISEVIISRKNSLDIRPFYSGTSVDSSTLLISGHETIANLISDNTNIYFKGYGGGGSATISIRGTGAGHTLLEWNGISINNPMLGQADFSIVPAYAADEIRIFYGSSSMKNNSGGIGGIINMETKPVWSDETSVTLSAGAGSFGSFSGSAAVRSGNLKFQSNTRAFTNISDNDFRYLNTETDVNPFWETMNDNRVRSNGFIQEIYYRGSRSMLSARFWYQSANRELPSSMLTRQPGLNEKQKDESVRTMLSYNVKNGGNDFSLTGAWITSRLDYTNNLASIYSRNKSETAVVKAGIENTSLKEMKLSFFINDELSSISSNNYLVVSSRNIATVTASAEKYFFGRLGTTVLIREIADAKTLLVPDYSAGIQYRIISKRDYFLKTTVSRNSKIPSMNELYWYPGGNMNLKNESSLQYELSYDMAGNIASGLSFEYDISGFRYRIKDMVLWHPGEFSYWTADNVQTVNSSGIETSLKLVYTYNKLISRLNAGYSYTRAGMYTYRQPTTNFQLPYVPVNQAYVALKLFLWRFYSEWDCNLTGKRYLTTDNTGYLPSCLLNNLTLGAKLTKKANSVDLSFRIENLSDKSYQAIAHYPMPGRAYFLKIAMNIIK
jgi:vitamin B12 transporter